MKTDHFEPISTDYLNPATRGELLQSNARKDWVITWLCLIICGLGGLCVGLIASYIQLQSKLEALKQLVK